MSTSGINELFNSKTPAIIYNDYTCPKCCTKMSLISYREKGLEMSVYFKCSNCRYTSPITRNIETNQISQTSKKSLEEFKKSFGEINK